MNGMQLPGLRGEFFDAAIAWELRSGRPAASNRMRMPAIETEGLTKDFLVGFWRPRPYRALDALTLSVEPGEVFGFLGPERRRQEHDAQAADAADLSQRAASARILGRPVGDVAVRRRIGFLAENPYYYDYLTAEELLTYFARLFGYSRRRCRRRASRACSIEVGLGAERRMRLRQFSKGMLQRVGLAQALINDPEVVFLDEPMSGLDPLGRREVRDLILQSARARLHGVLQLAHPVGRRGAVQPRRHHGAGPAGGVAAASASMLAFELKGWELVVADVRDDAARRARRRGARSVTPLAHGRFTLDLRAGCGTRAADGASCAPRRERRVAQSGARDARRLFRAAGARRAPARDGL